MVGPRCFFSKSTKKFSLQNEKKIGGKNWTFFFFFFVLLIYWTGFLVSTRPVLIFFFFFFFFFCFIIIIIIIFCLDVNFFPRHVFLIFNKFR